MAGKEGGHQRRRNTAALHLAFQGLPRGQHRDLDRVEHAVAGAQVAEAVPFGRGLEHPGIATMEALRVEVGERHTIDLVRLPDAEPPVLGIAHVHFLAQAHHGLAKGDGFAD
ncbi:hypothetical protein D9M69_664630 [compost metagenome]